MYPGQRDMAAAQSRLHTIQLPAWKYNREQQSGSGFISTVSITIARMQIEA